MRKLNAHRRDAAGLCLSLSVMSSDQSARLTHATVGTISVYEIAEWATSHVARHNRQAKRVLGEG